MSFVPGDQILKDPDAVLVYAMNWDAWLPAEAEISSSTWTISGPDAALSKDSEAVVVGDRATRLRLSGGTLGKRYTVTNRIVTNESPAQTEDRSFTIRVRNR
jgi:hypothetical protein